MAKKSGRGERGGGCLFQKVANGIYYARWQSGGKVYVRSCQTNKQRDAKRKLKEYTALFRLESEEKTLEAVAARLGGVQAQIAKIEDDKPATTIRYCWQAYLDQHNRPDSGPVTLSQYEGWYEAFARWIEERHPEVLELRQVTQSHADEYAGHLLKRVSATTFNRHINLLTLVWRVLAKTARLSSNPWKEIGRKRFQVHSRRELTLEELQRVCEAAQGEMRLLLAVGIYTGLRLGDAACLEWGSVDLLKGIISVIPSKTARRSQKRVTIPIHSTLHAMLSQCSENRRKGYVMPNMAARYQSFNAALAKDITDLFLSVNIKTNPNAMTKAEKDALKEAVEKAKAEGKELPQPRPKGQRARVDCGFHSLRHTFVSLCAAGGVSQSVVQSLVGHGSPAMTQHYTHVTLETAQSAVATLPDVTGTNTPPEHADATQAGFDAILNGLEKLSAEQLKSVVDRAQGLIGSLDKTEVK